MIVAIEAMVLLFLVVTFVKLFPKVAATIVAIVVALGLMLWSEMHNGKHGTKKHVDIQSLRVVCNSIEKKDLLTIDELRLKTNICKVAL